MFIFSRKNYLFDTCIFYGHSYSVALFGPKFGGQNSVAKNC